MRFDKLRLPFLGRSEKAKGEAASQEESLDQMIEEIVQDLNKEEEEEKEEEPESLRFVVQKNRRRILAAAGCGLFFLVMVILAIFFKTYEHVEVLATYGIMNASDHQYRAYQDGVLKYNRDGVSFLDAKGREVWNQSHQIKNPVLVTGGDSVAIADKGGNLVEVFGEEGLKGEVQTTLPIEKAVVSSQGIIGVVLTDGSTPLIACYDLAGNLLAEHRTTTEGIGYPIDLAISEDGQTLQVIYIRTEGGNIVSRLAYLHFGEEKKAGDFLVFEKEVTDRMYVSGFFLDERTSVAVADDGFTILKGTQKPEEGESVTFPEKIVSVFHDDSRMVFVLRESQGYLLKVYAASGKELCAKEIDKFYKNVELRNGKIILYQGKSCEIYTTNGQYRFSGEMENGILEIFPASGLNRYVVVDANGLESIRLMR